MFEFSEGKFFCPQKDLVFLANGSGVIDIRIARGNAFDGSVCSGWVGF